MNNAQQLYKNYDRLYFALSKVLSSDSAEKILKIIDLDGIISYICLNLKIHIFSDVKNVIDTIVKIKFFRDILIEKIGVLLVSVLDNPEGMDIILDLEDELFDNKTSKSITENVIINMAKHAMIYPVNRQKCINFMSKYDSEKIVHNTNLFYLHDMNEIVSKYLVKKELPKNNIFAFSTSCDSVNTLEQANKYYKCSGVRYSHLSFPKFMEYKKYIDFENKDNITSILGNISVNSRFEFIEFILDNFMNEKEEVFVSLRLSVYHGYATLPFIQTIVYEFRKRNIPLSNIFNKNRELITNTEIKNYLLHEQIYENHELIDTKSLIAKDYKNECFEQFRKDFVGYTKMLFVSSVNWNNRILSELEYVNTLVKENRLGWSESIKTSFNNFYDFTHKFSQQLACMEMAIAQYNSLTMLIEHTRISPTLALRCLNAINKLISKITFGFVIEHYADMINTCIKVHLFYTKLVREIFNINLEATEFWRLPENPTLAECFIDLYLHSCFDHEQFNVDENIKLLYELRKKKFFKIEKEVSLAISDFVPIKIIRCMLENRGIL